MFKTVTRDSTLTQRAREQIEDLIVRGAVRPGDRLPPERELGELLGVSRTVVREAVRLLAAQGLVDVRTGSGTFVRGVGPDIMKPSLDLLLRASALNAEDIHEVRALLEVRIAELAAQRARAMDIKAMEESISLLKNPAITAGEYAEVDVAFHCHLAAATQNPLFFALVRSLNGVMIEVRLRAASMLGDVPRERAIFYHSQILERVKAKDPQGARAAMIEHLNYAQDVMLLTETQARENALGRHENSPQQGGDNAE
jgi:GntR family transcriptional regulator, transcriptional repressor for pyruvate dehydrogenase complex